MAMSSTKHRIRDYETLRAVIDTGTTIGAARRLAVSQPAVSRCLAQLEDRLGYSLFTRVSGRIAPTAEALDLNEKLDVLFDALARIDGEHWARPEASPLKIAIPFTLAHHFVVDRLASFMKQDESRRVVFEIQRTEQIVAGILDQQFDLGMTGTSIQRAGVKFEPLREDRAVCVLPEGHPLAEREVIRLVDLDKVAMVGPVRHLGSGTLFARHGIKPRVLVETATIPTAVELVRAGVGLTLINPFPVLNKDTEGLVIRPFEVEIKFRTSFILSAAAPPSLQARNFMRHVRMTTPENSEDDP